MDPNNFSPERQDTYEQNTKKTITIIREARSVSVMVLPENDGPNNPAPRTI
jgi:hypothetical protein